MSSPSNTPRCFRVRLLWPKEHGAYGQLAFPVLTGLAVAGVNAAATLVVIAAIAGFLAHEPLLVLLGRRGLRVQRRERQYAITWLLAAGTVAIATGIAAFWLSMPSARWTFALPMTPAVLYGRALAAHAEKNMPAELAAAFAFSFVAVPLCLAAGAAVGTALLVGMTFALVSAASTLGVRIVVLKVRGGGNITAVSTTRLVLVSLLICMTAAIAAVTTWMSLPWASLAAIVPGAVVSIVLAVHPPSPTRLRFVGWTLVSASSFTMVLLVVGLRLA